MAAILSMHKKSKIFAVRLNQRPVTAALATSCATIEGTMWLQCGIHLPLISVFQLNICHRINTPGMEAHNKPLNPFDFNEIDNMNP